MRLALTIIVLALLACGGSDTAQTGGTDAAATAETAGADAPAAPPVAAAPEGSEPATPEPPANPQAQSCLDLVSQANFQQAIPVCMAALRIDPDNATVQEALSTAKAESATAAADAAAGSAAEEAGSRLGEVTGGALGGSTPE